MPTLSTHAIIAESEPVQMLLDSFWNLMSNMDPDGEHYTEQKLFAVSLLRVMADALEAAHQETGTPEGLCTACGTDYCAEHAPKPDLRSWVQHADGCEAWPQFTSHFTQATKRGTCTCGLDAALKESPNGD
jgi:hypothetical protein